MTPNAEQKHITLTSSIEEKILAYVDIEMIDTVLRNLISNALKFTNAGGRVTISATQDEQYVEVSVSDTGIGIDEKFLSKLFRIDASFHRKGTAGEKGTGLGLILCKDLTEKNGGRIWVESRMGGGSTFKFTLPYKEVKQDTKKRK